MICWRGHEAIQLVLPTDTLWGHLYYQAGLGLYDLLAGQQRIGRSRGICRDVLQESLPMLKPGRGGGSR